MTNLEQGRASLERARIILDEARSLQKKGVFNLVVRRAQEAVELALKGAMHWAGVDIPRIHDVGGILRQHSGRFPSNFQASIPKLASISRVLRAEREISFYGDEESGLPPEMLYDAADAEEALRSRLKTPFGRRAAAIGVAGVALNRQILGPICLIRAPWPRRFRSRLGHKANFQTASQ